MRTAAEALHAPRQRFGCQTKMSSMDVAVAARRTHSLT